jgi:hypothetical protein
MVVVQVLCGWVHSAEVECLWNQGARRHDEPMYRYVCPRGLEGVIPILRWTSRVF